MTKKAISFLYLTLFLSSCKTNQNSIDYTLNTYIDSEIATLNNHNKLDEDESYLSSLITAGLYLKSNDEENTIYKNELASYKPLSVTLKNIDETLYSSIYEDIGNPSYNSIFEIKLNEDAKFSNGNEIKADDYIESMKLLLDPLYNNYKAEVFTKSYPLINADRYFNQNKYYVESLYSILSEDESFLPSDGNYFLNVTKSNQYISNLFSNNVQASLYTLIYQSSFSKESEVSLKGQRIIDATINFLANSFFTYYDTIRTDGKKRMEHDDEKSSYLSFYNENKQFYENNYEDWLQLVEEDDENIVSKVTYSMIENHPDINMIEFDNHSLYVRKTANNDILSSNNSELYSYQSLLKDMNYFVNNLTSNNYKSPYKMLLFVNYINNDEVDFSSVGIKKKDDYTLYFFFNYSYSVSQIQELFCYNFLVDTSLYKSKTLKNSIRKETLYLSDDISSFSSYGPYQIDEIDDDKIILTKNRNYFLANDYVTDQIIVYLNLQEDEKTYMFLTGQLDYLKYSSSLTDYFSSLSIKNEYTTKIDRLSINSNYDSLISREVDSKNKNILSNINFRKGLYLALDRIEYASSLKLDCKPIYTLFSKQFISNPSTYSSYYDSRYGQSVRNTLEYSLSTDINKVSLDENKSNYISAINYLYAAIKEEIESSKLLSLKKGSTISLDVVFEKENDLNTRRFNYLSSSLNSIFESVNNKLVLEGVILDSERIKIELNKIISDDYESLISTGNYDLTFVTTSGNYLNPFSYINNFASSSYTCYEYNLKGRQSEEIISVDLNEDGKISDDEKKTYTEFLYQMNNELKEDNYSLFENEEDYNSFLQVRNKKLLILSSIEYSILSRYETIPLVNYTSSYLLSLKVKSNDKYSIINGYGSIKDYKFDYNNNQWNEFIKSNNNDLTDKYKR